MEFDVIPELLVTPVKPDLTDLYILDTETAGLSGGVVELGYLRVDRQLNVLEEVCIRTNPERPIERGASNIHGIKDEDVADCPTLAEVTGGFTAPIIFIGHNVSFDMRMVKPHIVAHQSMCTLALARLYVKGTTNHKLPTLKEELKLPEQKSHSALGDVYTVRDLLLHILPMTGVSMQTLLDRANEPQLLSKMPWGMHKGKTILRTPNAYRRWLLEQDGLDKDMRFTLEKFKDH